MTQLDIRRNQLRNIRDEEEREWALEEWNTELATALLNAVKYATKVTKTVTNYGNIITESYRVYTGEETHITVENTGADAVQIYYKHDPIFFGRNNPSFYSYSYSSYAQLKFIGDILTLCKRRSQEPVAEFQTTKYQTTKQTKFMNFFKMIGLRR